MIHRQKSPPKVGRMGCVCWQPTSNPKVVRFQFLGSGTQYGPLSMLIIVKPRDIQYTTMTPSSLLWVVYSLMVFQRGDHNVRQTGLVPIIVSITIVQDLIWTQKTLHAAEIL